MHTDYDSYSNQYRVNVSVIVCVSVRHQSDTQIERINATEIVVPQSLTQNLRERQISTLSERKQYSTVLRMQDAMQESEIITITCC